MHQKLQAVTTWDLTAACGWSLWHSDIPSLIRNGDFAHPNVFDFILSAKKKIHNFVSNKFISGYKKPNLENKLLLISINFTPKTSHSCL